ncbi:MAG: hypothetical protein VZR02_05125 [Lachnospiraceae bacterium]|nr:hypothetical protein [Lachnospiraceae bacterium]
MKKTFRFRYVPLILTAALIFLIYQYGSRASWNIYGDGSFRGISVNLVFYVVASLAVLVGYLLASFFTEHILRRFYNFDREDLAKPIQASLRALVLFFLAVAVFYLYKVYVSESLIYPDEGMENAVRQFVPHAPFFLFLFACSFVVFFLLEAVESAGESRTAGAVLFSFLNASLLYCPNPLEDAGSASVLHIHAYTASILQVAHAVPYGRESSSLYGHYGILYLPFVRLFGDSYRAIALSISLFGFLAFFAVFQSMRTVLRSDRIFFFAMTAASAATCICSRRGQYFQTNPHRMLFPCLLLLLITWEETGKTAENVRKWRISEWVFGSCAILWNTEMGLISVFALMLIKVFQALEKHPLFSLATGKQILMTLPYMPVDFLTAWAATGLYNLATGGGLPDFRTFLYPLMSRSFMVDTLRMPLQDPLAFYLLVLIVSYLCALSFLRMRIWRTKADEATVTVGFAAAISSLGCMAYFINRPVSRSIAVCLPQFAFLLALCADRIMILPKDHKLGMLLHPLDSLLTGTAFLTFFILFFTSVSTILELPGALESRATAVWKDSSMQTLESEIDGAVGKGTFAYGAGVPEVYQDLGWDTGLYGIDYADMDEADKERVETLVDKASSVLTTDNSFDTSDWELRNEWQTRALTFRYFVRKDHVA